MSVSRRIFKTVTCAPFGAAEAGFQSTLFSADGAADRARSGRTQYDRFSFAADIDLLALEAELLGQAYGLATSVLEEFGGLHRLGDLVYTMWYIPSALLAQPSGRSGFPLCHGYAGLAGSSSFTPSTVSVTDAGGSPSARSQPRATATRIAASIASRLSVASLLCTLSTCVQVGGGRRPVSSRTALSKADRNWAGLCGAAIGDEYRSLTGRASGRIALGWRHGRIRFHRHRRRLGRLRGRRQAFGGRTLPRFAARGGATR